MSWLTDLKPGDSVVAPAEKGDLRPLRKVVRVTSKLIYLDDGKAYYRKNGHGAGCGKGRWYTFLRQVTEETAA